MDSDNIEKINYSVQETPWYFGAYLNMARHNIFLLVNHLTERFSHIKKYKVDPDNRKPPKSFSLLTDDAKIADENILTKIFDPSIAQYDNDRFRVYKYLVRRHYLPFIKVFSESNGYDLDNNPIVDYQKLHIFIQEALSLLVCFRDSFSHYLAVDESRHKIDNRSLGITDNIMKSMERLYSSSSDFVLVRFAETQTDRDFDHLHHYKIFEEERPVLTEQGLYFFVNLFLERNSGIKFLKKFRGFKNETLPAFRATIKTFTAYALKVPDDRLDNDTLQMSLLMDMLGELQKCPSILYKHIDDEDRAKFEPELADDSKTNIILNSVNYQEVEDHEIDSMLANLTTHKRHQDRFSYFALRCIDELELLPNIRFQIALGNIESRAYPKNVGGVTINRRILKEFNAFGKLSDFDNNEDEVSDRLRKSLNDNQLAFDLYHPHYNINNNKIGFYIFKGEQERILFPRRININKEGVVSEVNQDHVPLGFLSLNELPKVLLLALKDRNLAQQVIIDFLKQNNSTLLNKKALYDIRTKMKLSPKTFSRRVIDEKVLIQRVHVKHLCNSEIKRVRLQKSITDENLGNLKFMSTLISKTKNLRDKEYVKQINYLHVLKTRKDILQGLLPDGIKVNQLPTAVLDYLLSLDPVNPYKNIVSRLKEVKRDTKQRLRRIAKSDDIENFRSGEIATFLARDIINCALSKDVKDKITAPYYDRLQNKLAYFSLSKEELCEIIQELNLFDTKIGHPFLTPVIFVKSRDLISFYDFYLSAKLRWIEQIVSKRDLLDCLKRKDIILPFKIARLVTKAEDNDFETWLNRKTKMPVNLPLGIFDTQVNTKLKEEMTVTEVEYNEGDKFTMLLSKQMQDDRQPFYDFRRIYIVDGVEVPYYHHGHSSSTIRGDYGRYAESVEKKIRHMLTKDRILKIACQAIFSNMGSMDEHVKVNLSDIVPFSNANPLNQPMRFVQKIWKDKEVSYSIIAEDSAVQKDEVQRFLKLETAEERKNFNGQKGYQWTVKDFGRFRRFVHDRRLFQIFNYSDSNQATFDMLAYQIAEYDRYREVIFRSTFLLEESLATKFFDELVLLKTNMGYAEVQFNEYLALIESRNLLSIDEMNFLRDTRNRFSHSQFPDYDSHIPIITEVQMIDFKNQNLLKGYKEGINLSICKKISEKYNTLIDRVI